jgi:hypothetical protein
MDTTAGRPLRFLLAEARPHCSCRNDGGGGFQTDQTRPRHFTGPACGPEGKIISLAFGSTRHEADQPAERSIVRNYDRRLFAQTLWRRL